MRKLLVLLLLLAMIPLYAQSSSAANSEYVRCFTQSEYATFEAQVQKVMEETAIEVAEAAVAPHLEYEAKLQREIDAKSRQILFWKITTGAGVGMALFFAILLAISHVVPAMP